MPLQACSTRLLSGLLSALCHPNAACVANEYSRSVYTDLNWCRWQGWLPSMLEHSGLSKFPDNYFNRAGYPDSTSACLSQRRPVLGRTLPNSADQSALSDTVPDACDVTRPKRYGIGQSPSMADVVRIMRVLCVCMLRWRRYILMSAVLSLAIYLIFLDPSGPVIIPDDAINIDELEAELEIGKPVRRVTYKSPLDNRLYAVQTPNQSKHARLGHVVRRPPKHFRNNGLWLWANEAVTKEELFPEDARVDDVLAALDTAAITSVDVLDAGRYESGTSEKWVVMLEGGQKAMMKLVWEEKGGMKNGALCNFGYEMPSGEIAAFHLHRILGFRNTPYVSGRVVNIRSDILPVASPAVAKQIKILNGNETCVEGKCYFCKEKLRICPANGQLEVSVAYWITRPLKLFTYPPKYMPYSTPSMEEWGSIGFNNRTYCDKIRKIEPYQEDRYYLDIFDFAALDTLMYHFDSKHYVIDDDSEARGLTIRLDHGRAFCAYDRDDQHIFMAPITQCCTMRKSTYDKLSRHRGTLGSELRERLSRDPLYPVLVEDWYVVLDRRLNLLLDMMERCAKANGGWDKVLVNE